MTELGKRIIELREKGYSYRKISNELNCSLNAVQYHLVEKTRLKNREKSKLYKNRKKNNIKVEKKHYKESKELLQSLHARRYGFLGKVKENEKRFSFYEFRDYLIKNNFCYLTGEIINIEEKDSYEIDHIIPKSKNGERTLNNLGLLSKKINQAKKDMDLFEFIDLCNKVSKFTKSKKFKKFLEEKQI